MLYTNVIFNMIFKVGLLGGQPGTGQTGKHSKEILIRLLKQPIHLPASKDLNYVLTGSMSIAYQFFFLALIN